MDTIVLIVMLHGKNIRLNLTTCFKCSLATHLKQNNKTPKSLINSSSRFTFSRIFSPCSNDLKSLIWKIKNIEILKKKIFKQPDRNESLKSKLISFLLLNRTLAYSTTIYQWSYIHSLIVVTISYWLLQIVDIGNIKSGNRNQGYTNHHITNT